MNTSQHSVSTTRHYSRCPSTMMLLQGPYCQCSAEDRRQLQRPRVPPKNELSPAQLRSCHVSLHQLSKTCVCVLQRHPGDFMAPPRVLLPVVPAPADTSQNASTPSTGVGKTITRGGTSTNLCLLKKKSSQFSVSFGSMFIEIPIFFRSREVSFASIIRPLLMLSRIWSSCVCL